MSSPCRTTNERWATASLYELSKALETSLLLDASPVGVKVLRSQHDFNTWGFPTPPMPLHYCSAVRTASEGSSLKMAMADMGCDTAPRTLGLEPGFMDDAFIESYVTAGLYHDVEQAREILTTVETLEGVYGLALGPLEVFEDTHPDVVIISSTPYAAMRVTQAATFSGTTVRSNNIGMHGVCSECTAAPLTTGRACTSLLCSGTRHIAGWNDDRVSTGIPAELLPGIVSALMSTLETYETDERKSEMRSSCSCAAPQPSKVAEEVSQLSEGTGYFYRATTPTDS